MALPRQEVCPKTDTRVSLNYLRIPQQKAVGLAQADGLISLCFKEHRS